MTFAAPWMLLALFALPLLVTAYVQSRRRRTRRSAELAAQGLVPLSPLAMRKRRHVPFALSAAGLTLMIVALAKPQTTLTLPRREGTVILAFDASNSMAATDLKPTRIEAAKAAARAFVQRQPSEVKVGVVAFGDAGVVVQTPTTVKPDVLASIDRISINGGTALGQGIYTSLNAIAGKPLVLDERALNSDSGEVDIGYFGGTTIVLLSDGENTGRPDPLALADLASAAGVRIHTIGLGTAAGTVVEVEGFAMATALDAEVLGAIAERTDGAFHQAEDSAALNDIYKSIKLEFKTVSERTEISGLFAAGGGLLLVAAALLSLLWFGRVI